MTCTMKLLSRSAIGTALVVGLWVTLVQPASAEIFPCAFAAHQQTPHFKMLIAGEASPKLAKRDRAQCAMLA
jgi:hypothetical protein